ncbi:MAG: NAD+ synthase [Candidatus Sericytochromatia bacterium]|nr:NAD+ synthase [Candidatus Sericytochromatia bacterium]
MHATLPRTGRLDPAVLNLDVDLVRRVLVAFLREEVQKAGFNRVVLGLSGGIDSAVVAALAVAALGADAVTAVAMPYRLSSSESLEDGRSVARSLGLEVKVQSVTPMADALLESLEGEVSGLRRGNLLARCRMIVLYDCSAADHALVLGTSNKTELLLGYGTLHGDMASALNPIGDLYKTQVRALARALAVPTKVVDKPPSADLVPGQTDEDDLGASYADFDLLLHALVDERRTPEELLQSGVEPEFLEYVLRRVRTMQFKRRPPVIAKLASRTVDKDFHHLRDWGT